MYTTTLLECLDAHDSKFAELAPFLFDEKTSFDSLAEPLQMLEHLYPIDSKRNFPFGGSVALTWSKEHICAILSPWERTDKIISSYFDTYEKTHAMQHRPTFEAELKTFRQDPSSMDDAWRSQLLMVLALGSSTKDTAESSSFICSCLEGAEAYMMQTQFMAKPSLSTVRCLVMMALAKQLNLVSGDDADGVWSFFGLVFRLALSIGLHRDPAWFQSITPVEAEIRKRTWTTIMFMDTHHALESGMPPLSRGASYDSPAPSNINDEDFSNEDPSSSLQKDCGKLTDSTFQIILQHAFPTVFQIIWHAHLPMSRRLYDDVIHAEARIRELLRVATSKYKVSHQHNEGQALVAWEFQHTALEIYFRRVLLALHQPYALLPHALAQYPNSHQSALESACALLVFQRKLHDGFGGLVSMEWLAELLRGDFFLAALFVALGIRRQSFGQQETNATGAGHSEIDIASQSLDACLEIWAVRVCRSSYHFKAHLTLVMVISVLRSSSTDVSLEVTINTAITTATAAVKASPCAMTCT